MYGTRGNDVHSVFLLKKEKREKKEKKRHLIEIIIDIDLTIPWLKRKEKRERII